MMHCFCGEWWGLGVGLLPQGRRIIIIILGKFLRTTIVMY